MTSGIFENFGLEGGGKRKISKIPDFSNFSSVPKKFSLMTILTSAYNFHVFWLSRFLLVLQKGKGGEAPRKMLEFFQAVFYVFRGVSEALETF